MKTGPLADPGAPERTGQEEHAEYGHLHPTQRERFARVNSSKLNPLASLVRPACVQEKDSGETGNGKKVLNEKLPPESTAIRSQGPELFHELGSDVDV